MVRRLALCLALGALPGCLSLSGFAFSCSVSSDCPAGLVCVNAVCQQSAAASSSTGTGTGTSSGNSGATSTGGNSTTGGSGSTGGSSSSGSTGSSSGGSSSGGSTSGSGSSSGSSYSPPLTFTTLTVFVGQPGGEGYLDGVGADTRFDYPQELAADDGGNLYIADTGNHVIRMVTPVGVVTTLAGAVDAGAQNLDGVGLAASFDGPSGILWDGQGDLYVGDKYACTIRKVVIATQVVSTVAGTVGACVDQDSPAATFNQPEGLATDGVNLYIGEEDGNRIRMLALDSGTVTTVAGSNAGYVDGPLSSATFIEPARLAYNAGGLFVADDGNNVVRLVNLDAGLVTTVVGTGVAGEVNGPALGAELTIPHGLAFDGNGSLFVADWGQTIREVADGGVATFAGSGAIGYADGTGTAAHFYDPDGLAFAAGALFVSDKDNSIVRRISDAGVVTTLAGSPPNAGPLNGVGTAANFRGPRGLAFDGNQTLYVADSDGEVIRSVNVLSAAVSQLAGMEHVAGKLNGAAIGGATFDAPWGLACDADAGYLYVSDNLSGLIRAIDLGTLQVSTLVPGITFSTPRALALDGLGNLYVAEAGSNEIRQIVLATGATSVLAGATTAGDADGTGALASFNEPAGLAYDAADGVLYVTDSINSTIRRVSLPGGAVTTVAGVAGVPGLLNLPNDLAYDGHGNLFVSNGFAAPGGNSTVVVVSFDGDTGLGSITPILGVPFIRAAFLDAGVPGLLNDPHGLALVPGQGLFVADYNENAVLLAH